MTPTEIQASGLLNNIPKWTPPGNWPVAQFTGNQLADIVPDSIMSSESECIVLNNSLVVNYYHAVDSVYRSAAQKGIKPVMPPVPLAWDIFVDNGAAPGAYSYGPNLGGPVCPALPPPPDHSLSQAQIQASLPPGQFDLGPTEGGGIFQVGPQDSMPAGVIFTGPDGHRYLKFSWVGFGYKYQQVL